MRRSGELEQKLVGARSRAQERRGAILAEAEATERSVIGAAREAANQTIAEVRGAIADELVSARSALESDVRGLAREAAVKILGREL